MLGYDAYVYEIAAGVSAEDIGRIALESNEERTIHLNAAIPCASGWGETPALLTFALHGARTDQY